jgi:hypothetical protein
MEWLFQGGIEEFSIKVDKEKKIYIKSKITNFEWLPFDERLFKDREQRNRCHIMNIKVPKLNIEQLHVYIITEILYGKFTQCYKYLGFIDDEGKYIANEVENKQKQIENECSTIRK